LPSGVPAAKTSAVFGGQILPLLRIEPAVLVQDRAVARGDGDIGEVWNRLKFGGEKRLHAFELGERDAKIHRPPDFAGDRQTDPHGFLFYFRQQLPFECDQGVIGHAQQRQQQQEQGD
jgi:hypothetical protein